MPASLRALPVFGLLLLAACSRSPEPAAPAAAATTTTPPATAAVDTRAIAKEAYVYGYPMVDNYRIQYAYFVDKRNPEYKGGWNQVHNTARVYTPKDKAIQTPNSDTPYSAIGADLRAEPLVISVPAVEKGRYYSAQFIDMYTFNFAYVGSRATGNEAGNFLLAGPNWKGETPKGIKQVIRSETELAFVLFRTQLFNAADIENVKKIQAGYKVQPLSKFMGTSPPPAAPPIAFVEPLTPDEQKGSLEFFSILNWLLQFCPTPSSETAMMERFAKIGVGAGKTFDAASLSPQDRAAFEGGIADAWKDLEQSRAMLYSGKMNSGDLFGTRAFLHGDYLRRMSGAVMGIYGNSKEEALYPAMSIDDSGKTLDGANRYTVRFAPGQLPPANAFWSLTMYEMPASLLTENPLDRYLINSPMLPSLKKDADGGITLYIQHDSPGKDKESNWLPAPAGPFGMAMRVYWPKPEALDGTWKAPKVQRVQ